jgi:hypothetical protein
MAGRTSILSKEAYDRFLRPPQNQIILPVHVVGVNSFVIISLMRQSTQLGSNVDLATMTDNSPQTCCLHSQVILHRLEVDGNLSGQQANTSDVIPIFLASRPALLMLEYW